MIHDPKKPIDPAGPVKNSPRMRDRTSAQVKTLEAGVCSGCRKPYGFDAQIVEYTPLGTTDPTEFWHPDCWKASNRDAMDRLKDGPGEWPWK